MVTHAKKRAATGRELSGTNLSRAGDYNQRVVLQAIRAAGTATRGEVAAVTGLTQQSIINITRRLIAEGLVVEAGRTASLRGQPATRLTINADGAYAIGLNIDRDHMTFLVMDLGGRVRERVYLDRHFALPSDVLDFLKSNLDLIFADRRFARRRLLGVGLAIPDRLGEVEVTGRPAAYDQWSTVDIARVVAAHLEMPVFAENDATSAAIGESQFGHGHSHKTFVYTLISAGLGCGLIINGQPYAGSLTHAGEIGNIPIASPDGGKSTLWDAVSLYALYRELAAHGFAVSHPDELKADDVAMTPAIDAWVEKAARYMAEPFLAITYLLSPDMHFIGGQLPVFIAEKLCARLNTMFQTDRNRFAMAWFRTASTSVDAAAMGAASLVFQNRLLPTPDALKNQISLG
ncbi:ROK family transcriptional regulator [Asticcacaulis sp. AC402]|uniref:ROK family transcriptional regulator n=1 Tax=Asticcacaulis sp. AC402 TaxID=1282361 RepID=UPI0003C3BAAC|nr:ROK family transcriptional regulator [Asticcacaulis sp. AC402]ESQ74527.1 ROK family transcriptional regulator [Asticcacaulis sp. AC402]